MTVTTLSSREFNQHVGEAKKAARTGPVFITDRGRPSHVLLCYEEYQRLNEAQGSIADRLAMPGAEDIEFEPVRAHLSIQPADIE